jgi:hypothetical protein
MDARTDRRVREEIRVMRQELRGGPAIEQALKKDFVYCRIRCSFGQLDEAATFTVKDVRKKNGELQVQILEDWFYPAEVWTEVEDV